MDMLWCFLSETQNASWLFKKRVSYLKVLPCHLKNLKITFMPAFWNISGVLEQYATMVP